MRTSTLSLRRTSSPAPGGRTKVAAVTQSESTDSPQPNQRVVSSDALLQGRKLVSIMHNGETYQLRATRLGKLILTK